MTTPPSWIRRDFLAGTGASLAFALVPTAASTNARAGRAPAPQDLQNGFDDPPMDARPRIWWFWGESVTTDEGITQDLEAYKRVAFGGVVLYEQVFKAAPGALACLSPAWLDRVRFAAAECARLGLALEVNVSDGYVAGGPWITPDLGMQRLVASEHHVDASQAGRIVLRQPETRLAHYRDVACLAWPAAAGAAALPRPRLASNTPAIDLGLLFASHPPGTQSKRQRARIHPREDGQAVLVELDYGTEVTLRSLSFSQRKNAKALVIATQETPGVPVVDGVSMRGARRGIACSSTVTKYFRCSNPAAATSSFQLLFKNITRESPLAVPAIPALSHIGPWWPSSMNMARFGRHEVYLATPRTRSSPWTRIDGQIFIHASVLSPVCKMNG